MKKLLSVLLSAVMLFGSISAVNAENDVKVILDGTELTFDVPPQIIEGRTLVPLRVIFEALGADVTWEGETQTVTATKGDATIQMIIGSSAMYIDDESITLDVPPQIIDGRTLVPARAVAESFGAEVEWDGENRIVTITSAVEEAKYEIKYDDTLERQAHYMRDFQIKNITKNTDGDFEITYTLRTFMEGRGTVVVEFNCLDANGSVIGNFSGSFLGSDYAWNDWEETATIPGETAEIQLILKD
ncbi:MAG: copper amine oxidase N-terminal domain-containing protein [Clostridia bacterium]|nr:copper amine oxidase N-terminal domain-containing protein [Clostridia bacterium]